jgi:hypothetical protein
MFDINMFKTLGACCPHVRVVQAVVVDHAVAVASESEM